MKSTTIIQYATYQPCLSATNPRLLYLPLELERANTSSLPVEGVRATLQKEGSLGSTAGFFLGWLGQAGPRRTPAGLWFPGGQSLSVVPCLTILVHQHPNGSVSCLWFAAHQPQPDSYGPTLAWSNPGNFPTDYWATATSLQWGLNPSLGKNTPLSSLFLPWVRSFSLQYFWEFSFILT